MIDTRVKFSLKDLLQTTKRLTTILLMISFVVSCKSKIICAEIKRDAIKYLPLCTVKLDFNNCNCRCFDFNNWATVDAELCGPDFVEGNQDLELCDGISGFYTKDMALEVRPKIKDLARVRLDYCKF